MTKLKLLETKFLPPNISNPAVINIYGDRVVNVIWKEKYPLCFVMVNKDVADAYKKHFELLWKSPKDKHYLLLYLNFLSYALWSIYSK